MMILFASTTLAFFNFFQQEDSDQQDSKKPVNINCEWYTCSDNSCAQTPLDCPCPNSKIKCQTKDWFYCISGHQKCFTV